MSRFKEINDTFKDHFADIKINKKLLLDLRSFRMGWMTKGVEYSEFLGGSLIGVDPIKFTIDDEEVLMVDILGVDLESLRSDINATKGINPSWEVSSHPVYQSMLQLIHRARNSKIDKELEEDIISEAYFIFAYKAISSLVTHYFKYGLDRRLALAVFEKLSNRYLLKKLGSWQAVFDYRVLDMFKGGLHYDRIKKNSTDDSIRVANDLQGRIRDIVKYLFLVVLEVKNSNSAIATDSLHLEYEDSDTLEAITDRTDKFQVFIRTVMTQPTDLIKSDLLHLISLTLPKVEMEMVRESLLTFHEEAWENKKLLEINDDILVTSIKYLRSRDVISNYNSSIMDIMVKLKGYWTSSRVREKEVIEVKKQLVPIVYKAIQKKTSRLISNVSLAVILYIVLRAISMKTYK